MSTQPPLHQRLTKIVSLTVRRLLADPASAERWAKGLWIAVYLTEVGPYFTAIDRGTRDEAGGRLRCWAKGFFNAVLKQYHCIERPSVLVSCIESRNQITMSARLATSLASAAGRTISRQVLDAV